jgi:hypothetical protein
MPSPSYFPDGVKIGPEAPGGSDNDRLPLYELDEWFDNLNPGTMSAGEVKVLEFTNVTNLRQGVRCVGAAPMNQGNSQYDNLLVMGCWSDGNSSIFIRVKNIAATEIEFTEDQWIVTHFNTSEPPQP